MTTTKATEKWLVYDRQTGRTIGTYSSMVRAANKVDKLDNAYGSYRYGFKRA